MSKLWRIVRHEYLKRVKQRSFLMALLGVPLLIVVVAGIAALTVMGLGDRRPVGYVDHAGIIDERALADLTETRKRFWDLRPYEDEALARDALEDGVLQAFYVVPETYLTDKELTLIYDEDQPGEQVRDNFADLIRASLAADYPAPVRARLAEGLDLTVRSEDGRRELSEGNALAIVIPFLMVFFLYFGITAAGGYLLQAITDEKENRMVEVLATSVSPKELMTGKALGLMGVSLTQMVAWIAAAVLAAVIAVRASVLPPVEIPWASFGIALLYFLPTFGLVAGIMITIGAAVTEQQQGQQVSGIINILFILPTFFSTIILASPNSPFLTILTLFPTTTFLTVLLRWSLSAVPLWEMVTSWCLLSATAVASLWAAARVFRIGMLRYGQRLDARGILDAVLRRPSALSLDKEISGHA
jgi:ABC-2 type transport system permease protein